MPRKRPPSSDTSLGEQTTRILGDNDNNLRETVVMFVDIVGSSEVSNHKQPKEYAKFVRGFQNLFTEVCEHYKKGWDTYHPHREGKIVKFTVRGDEGLLLISSPRPCLDVSIDIDLAVNIALELKREWLCLEANAERINLWSLLPIDLGIGIHAGTTYMLDNQLEGYTINLAKRVESHSRQGRYSHIMLSEAAHGYLDNLPDETTYLFDKPQVVSPKGISRDIRLYEVKHHFLPADWKEESAAERQTESLLVPPTEDQIATLKAALKINPTNLWLSEEFIRGSMLYEFNRLGEADRENESILRSAFDAAQERADILRQSSQRDAGIMFIRGLIQGEYSDYQSERENYNDAISYSDQIAHAHYYLGLSYSYELDQAINCDMNKKYTHLDPQHCELADRAICELKEARKRRPRCAWMLFDYGCELIRWEKEPGHKEEGIQLIETAVQLLPAVAKKIPSERYLDSVRDHQKIRNLI